MIEALWKEFERFLPFIRVEVEGENVDKELITFPQFHIANLGILAQMEVGRSVGWSMHS